MRIAILYTTAGHGHLKAAEAIREGLLACGIQGRDILFLDALEEAPAWFAALYTSAYYNAVKHAPKAWGFSYHLLDQSWFYQSIGRRVRRLVNSKMGSALVRRMAQEKPDAILMTHFFPPEVLGQAKLERKLTARLISVVTDYLPHSFWINPGTDHYWVMSEEGREVLEHGGVPSDRITPGGIPISFHFVRQEKKQEFRTKLGLDEFRFGLLLTSGSFGLGPTEQVLDSLKEFGERIQVLVVCGNNQSLLEVLKRKNYSFPIKIFGFVSNMDELMEASDLLIAKPGGITTTESLAKGLPMVVLEAIPGQEEGNVEVLKKRNAAFFLGRPSDIHVVLKGILDYPQVLEEKRRSIQQLAKPEAAIELARFVLKGLT